MQAKVSDVFKVLNIECYECNVMYQSRCCDYRIGNQNGLIGMFTLVDEFPRLICDGRAQLEIHEAREKLLSID